MASPVFAVDGRIIAGDLRMSCHGCDCPRYQHATGGRCLVCNDCDAFHLDPGCITCQRPRRALATSQPAPCPTGLPTEQEAPA